MQVLLFIVGIFFFLVFESMHALPFINLGATSFFDGGPLRAKKGWYVQQYLSYYHSNKLVIPQQGSSIVLDPSPAFDGLSASTQLIYMSPFTLLKAHVGGVVSLPMGLLSKLEHNPYGLRTSGVGVGDLGFGFFLQWDAIMDKRKQPIIVSRFEVDVSFPTGKNNHQPRTIYPGNGYFFVSPYLASTLFLTKDWACSWRFSYLWCAQEPKLNRQFGKTFYTNFATEYRLTQKLFVGLNGYFVQQLSDTKISGEPVLGSKERVLGVGPGFLYTLGDTFDFVFLSNLYFETCVKNRPQGVRIHFRLLKHF